MSVIKRLFGEHITSKLVRTQNRELSFICIAYNMHRMTNLFLLLMISTEPNRNNNNDKPSNLKHNLLLSLFLRQAVKRALLFALISVKHVKQLYLSKPLSRGINRATSDWKIKSGSSTGLDDSINSTITGGSISP